MLYDEEVELVNQRYRRNSRLGRELPECCHDNESEEVYENDCDDEGRKSSVFGGKLIRPHKKIVVYHPRPPPFSRPPQNNFYFLF
jgi:hypothetical protein